MGEKVKETLGMGEEKGKEATEQTKQSASEAQARAQSGAEQAKGKAEESGSYIGGERHQSGPAALCRQSAPSRHALPADRPLPETHFSRPRFLCSLAPPASILRRPFPRDACLCPEQTRRARPRRA